jgi:hypothetical protein
MQLVSQSGVKIQDAWDGLARIVMDMSTLLYDIVSPEVKYKLHLARDSR